MASADVISGGNVEPRALDPVDLEDDDRPGVRIAAHARDVDQGKALGMRAEAGPVPVSAFHQATLRPSARKTLTAPIHVVTICVASSTAGRA